VSLAGPELVDHFLAEQRRCVQKDRTVTLDGVPSRWRPRSCESASPSATSQRASPTSAVEVWHRRQRVEIAKRVAELTARLKHLVEMRGIGLVTGVMPPGAENRLRPLLIVDEAHHLRTDLLEDLRLPTHYAMDSENRLTMMLVGHPELRRRINMAALDALAQRIVVRATVRGLTREEMGPYLAHRLRLAGTELPLFEPPTVEAVYRLRAR
jgi:hypothetical protein